MVQSRKTTDKWVSAILSMVLPGVGHMYLGYMGRGLAIVGAFIVDIVLIIFASLSIFIAFPIGIALVTLFGLVIPVIYFFSIFDALQLSERKHSHGGTRPQSFTTDGADFAEEDWGWPDDLRHAEMKDHAGNGSRVGGIALIAVGVVLLIGFLLPNPLFRWVFDHLQTVFAILLLACGAWLLWKQRDRRKGDHS